MHVLGSGYIVDCRSLWQCPPADSYHHEGPGSKTVMHTVQSRAPNKYAALLMNKQDTCSSRGPVHEWCNDWRASG